MLKTLKKINYLLPAWGTAPLKHIPENIIFGRSYSATKKKVSFEEKIVKDNLFNALMYAREHTQFGKENIPSEFSKEEVLLVLQNLPKMSSKDLVDNLPYYISDEANKHNSYTTTTGGSGRNPTTICLSNSSFGAEWAHMFDIWQSVGYQRSKNLKLTFRGYHFPNGVLYRLNPIYNEIMVDSFQLWQSDFVKFIKEIKKYPISALHGYPSLINIFMEKLKENNLTFPVKMIFLGSEGASKELKQEFSTFFDAKIAAWYGQSEKVILAADTELSGNFKVYSSYGYADVSNPDENGFGEIIGTTFVNKALPLINYRTGDFGKIFIKNGIRYLIDIQGRWGKDFVYLDKKTKIPTSAINLHTEVQTKILFYQIQQDRYATLDIRVLPKKQFDTKELKEKIIKEIRQDLQERLKNFNLNIYCVKNESEIIRSVRGKQIMLVQNIKENL